MDVSNAKIMVQAVVILPQIRAFFTLLFSRVTWHNSFESGCQSIVFVPRLSFHPLVVYMLLSHSEESRAGFVDDLRDGKHTGASNASSI